MFHNEWNLLYTVHCLFERNTWFNLVPNRTPSITPLPKCLRSVGYSHLVPPAALPQAIVCRTCPEHAQHQHMLDARCPPPLQHLLALPTSLARAHLPPLPSSHCHKLKRSDIQWRCDWCSSGPSVPATMCDASAALRVTNPLAGAAHSASIYSVMGNPIWRGWVARGNMCNGCKCAFV